MLMITQAKNQTLDYLNKEFFKDWSYSLVKDDASVDRSVLGRKVTFFDFDITSILQRGWSPTNQVAEKNKIEFFGMEGIKDLGVVDALISTNETGIESAYRIAGYLGRDITEFGANIQHTATAANVLGVNDLRLQPIERPKYPALSRSSLRPEKR